MMPYGIVDLYLDDFPLSVLNQMFSVEIEYLCTVRYGLH